MPHPDFVSAAVRLAKRYPHSPPGRASHYLHHFRRLVESGKVPAVVLWTRVSGNEQQRRGNRDDQDPNLRHVARRLGVRVAGVVGYTGSGADLDDMRLWLERAVALARKHGGAVLAETTDRFARHPFFNPKTDPGLIPMRHQFKALADLAGDVILATHLHPDASPKQVRSYQTKRGQRAKGKPGGRPKNNPPGYKKERREAMRDEVIRLRKLNVSRRRIAALIGVAYPTVRRWVAELL